MQNKRKLRVANVIPPYVSMSSSFLNLAKVYSYIAKKYDVEITIFVDSKINFSFEGLKTKKVSGFDINFSLYKIPFFLGLPRLWYPSLARYLKGYDVIESSTPEFYIFTIQAYLAAKKHNARYVLRTSQTKYDFYLFPYTKNIALYFAKKACAYAKWLCFTNPTSKQAYINIGLINKNAKNTIILGHAIDTSIFRPMKFKKDSSKRVLLSVGALYKLKGHQNIIKTLRILVDRGFSNLELWIAGEGNYRQELESLVNDLKLNDKVKFLGAQDHFELAKTYNKIDIFVLGNLHDVTPAVSEAMLCNVPVVASRCGGIDFVIPSENHGIITKYDDPDALAKGVEEMLKNPQLAKRLVKTARKFILDNFSIEKVAEKLYKAYTK